MLGSLFARGEKKAMNERQQILEMLANGKISVAEAEKLLDAVSGAPGNEASGAKSVATAAKSKPKFLRISVSESDGEKVNVRIPLQLVRAGVKLGSLIPEKVQTKIDESMRENGMQFSLKDIRPETVEELIGGLSEFEVNVNDDGDGVRIYCE